MKPKNQLQIFATHKINNLLPICNGCKYFTAAFVTVIVVAKYVTEMRPIFLVSKFVTGGLPVANFMKDPQPDFMVAN